MWFQRNPDVHRQLEREIEDEEILGEVISETIFYNGAFRKIPCIEKWIMKLRARGAKEQSISAFVGAIKQVCLGKLPHKHAIEDWGIKHPRALTLDDALRYNSELMKRNLKGRRHRLALRNFLKNQNVEGWDEISGKLEQDAGKYAHLYITGKKIYEILEYLKRINHDAYLAVKFGYKTACRTGATLNAHAKYINYEERTICVFEKATRGKPKRKQEKVIPDDLWNELPKEGKLFNIEPNELNGLLRRAYQEIIPELAEEIPQPFHFIARHQFAQHLLRETGWNYGLVARLGHWAIETLERYYGKMDRQVALSEGRKHLPHI